MRRWPSTRKTSRTGTRSWWGRMSTSRDTNVSKEVLLDEVELNQRGARIAVRCAQGPIALGDRFVRLNQLHFISYEVPHRRVDLRNVDLRVVGINLFGKQLDVMDQGLTGWLTVDGLHCSELAGVGLRSLSD